MTSVETIHAVLGWCTIMNFALLMVWFLFFVFAHNWLYRFHSSMFKMPEETFNAIHYGAMAVFKLAILMFNFAPYVALLIVRQAG